MDFIWLVLFIISGFTILWGMIGYPLSIILVGKCIMLP